MTSIQLRQNEGFGKLNLLNSVCQLELQLQICKAGVGESFPKRNATKDDDRTKNFNNSRKASSKLTEDCCNKSFAEAWRQTMPRKRKAFKFSSIALPTMIKVTAPAGFSRLSLNWPFQQHKRKSVNFKRCWTFMSASYPTQAKAAPTCTVNLYSFTLSFAI